MLIEYFDRYGPADIFGIIDNQSANRELGERLIKRYGDRRAMESVIEYQKTQGIEIDGEIEQRIFRIGELLDELHEKTEAALSALNTEKGVTGK
jgi:hypothetical protein